LLEASACLPRPNGVARELRVIQSSSKINVEDLTDETDGKE
jgi:hypothetical protein